MAKEKVRQRVCKSIIFVMFLLFPVLYYYFSPYLIIMGASEGVVSGSFIVFGLMFIVSLFLGRAFCGWVCPAGGEQELCAKLRDSFLYLCCRSYSVAGTFSWKEGFLSYSLLDGSLYDHRKKGSQHN